MTAVSTVTASDPAFVGDVTYSIFGGTDAAKFAIDSATGALTFIAAPNFEAPTDGGANNVYDVVIKATDGTLTDTLALAVTINNVNEAPVLTNNGGGATASINVAENTTAVTTLTATDQDAGDTKNFKIYGGADASKFAIDGATGALTFIAAPDFENPLSAAGTNVYDVIVAVEDAAFSSDVQTLAVTVTNVAEAPVINSDGAGATASLTINENTTAVTTVAATDSDTGTTITYSISGGADAAKFAINATTGALSFVAAPNFEVPTDAGTNNVYDVVVKASDGTLFDTQAIAVTVANVNEPAVITSNPTGAVSVAENTTAVTTVHATDAEGAALVYGIVAGGDSALFAINGTTGALTFIGAPDFENKLDAGADNVYNVTVSVSDGAHDTTQALAVTVTNVNDAPVIQSDGAGATAAITINENTTAVTTVTATDQDVGNVAMVYSVSGADAAKFNIDAATGALSFKSAPNFEAPTDTGANNVYDVIVTATSDGGLTDTQAIAVTVANVNEPAVITSNPTNAVSVVENTKAVTTVTATDPEGATPIYGIVAGGDSALFAINATTGALTFIGAPDYETPGSAAGTNVYTVTVSASDGAHDTTQTLAVTVTNAFENAPTITSNGGTATAAISFAENSTAVTTVVAGGTDVGPVTYSISGGADAGKFTINSATGALAFVAAPDFETKADAGADNTYDVVVKATGAGGFSTQAIAVSITNVNEAPVITSNGGGATAAVSVDETVTTVTTVKATDVDAGTTLTYSISGGADAAKFGIDATTGVLSFLAAPNTDTPGDAGADNVYDVIVQASDGSLLVDTQALAITVSRVINGGGEADTLTGTAGVDHLSGFGGKDVLNGLAGNDVLDGGAGADRMYGGQGDDTYIVDSSKDVVVEELNGGTDTVLASIRTFNLGDNVENVTFSGTVSHGSKGNALDNVLTGNDGADTLSGQGGNDTLIGLGGNDKLSGGEGNDRLDGGAGVDIMSGGRGNDTMVVDNVLDKVSEGNGQGVDTVESSINYKLGSNVEKLVLTGTAALNGTGNTLDNTLTGNAADNILDGGKGDDTLIGGLGKDTLIGGANADHFVFNSALNAATNVDTVADFVHGDGDQIHLSLSIFTAAGALGQLAQTAFFADAGATAAHDSDDRIIYDTASGKLYYDADGLGGAAAVQFATIGATVHPTLFFSDFQIIA